MSGRDLDAAQQLRLVLGHLPTGVTVVTAVTPDGPVGMAANSFGSVSLDPPLALLCPARSSTTWPHIRAVARFCVNVMGGEHADITRRFSWKGVDRFAGLEVVERPCGPGLREAVAWIDCAIEDEHDAGDHTIVVASILDIAVGQTLSPLVFFRGDYGTFAPLGATSSPND